jgi:hypothetical protein
MNRFTPQEIDYLQSQRLGRMATLDSKGDLHVVPLSFRYNPEEDTIDLGGHSGPPRSRAGELPWAKSHRMTDPAYATGAMLGRRSCRASNGKGVCVLGSQRIN